jgi:hypothetical protein
MGFSTFCQHAFGDCRHPAGQSAALAVCKGNGRSAAQLGKAAMPAVCQLLLSHDCIAILHHLDYQGSSIQGRCTPS